MHGCTICPDECEVEGPHTHTQYLQSKTDAECLQKNTQGGVWGNMVFSNKHATNIQHFKKFRTSCSEASTGNNEYCLDNVRCRVTRENVIQAETWWKLLVYQVPGSSSSHCKKYIRQTRICNMHFILEVSCPTFDTLQLTLLNHRP